MSSQVVPHRFHLRIQAAPVVVHSVEILPLPHWGGFDLLDISLQLKNRPGDGLGVKFGGFGGQVSLHLLVILIIKVAVLWVWWHAGFHHLYPTLELA